MCEKCTEIDKTIERGPLSRWSSSVEQLGNRGDELGRGERLGEHDAIWHAFGGPRLGTVAAHVNHGKLRIDLPCVAADLPAVRLVAP